MIENYQERRTLEKQSPMAAQFATVGAVYSNGITLKFDGESAASSRRWPYNSAVNFSAGQRVRVEKIGGTYVVAYPVKGG